VFAPLLLVTLDALRLPTAVCGHWISLKFAQSVQGWGSWAWDWIKAALINILLGTFLTWLLYAVIRRSPRRWWLYFWLALVPLIILGAFLDPLVVDPLFYKFEPLVETHPQLVSEVERVARRGGLEILPERILEMKASEKLKAANAYVTGLGASKRVVVWDTTLRLLDTPQTLALFGHEMGHYVLHHVWQGIGFAAVVLFVFLALLFRLAHSSVRRWGRQWEIRGVEDWASLPVLLLLASLSSFLASPGIQAYSRYLEHQADVYGLEVTYGVVLDAGRAAAESHQILAEADLEDPDPPAFIVFWLYSHPPSRERIEFARAYDPWSTGRSPEFVK
jgi:Zn-dependent protease with chaperone function